MGILLPLLLFKLASADWDLTEYHIPDIEKPDIDKGGLIEPEKYVEWTARISTDETLYYFEAIRSMMSRHPLNVTEMNEIRDLYPNVTGNWLMFNEEIDVDSNKYMLGTEPDLARVMAYRRVVLSEDEMRKFKESSKELDDGEIDFFDEYIISKKCVNGDTMESGLPVDSIVVDSVGKVHYTRNTLYCGFEYPACNDLHNYPDDWQGKENPLLAEMAVRVSNGHRANIKKWRSFVGCIQGKSSSGTYPTFEDRLAILGFEKDLLSNPTPAELRALKEFSLGYLNDWRRKTELFTEEQIDLLEEKDRNNWQWKYLVDTNQLF